jgi:hypothetical protein
MKCGYLEVAFNARKLESLCLTKGQILGGKYAELAQKLIGMKTNLFLFKISSNRGN